MGSKDTTQETNHEVRVAGHRFDRIEVVVWLDDGKYKVPIELNGALVMHDSVNKTGDVVRMIIESVRDSQHSPKYGPGQRVVKKGEQQTGRVQSVAFDRVFRYLVKWDRGFESTHDEADLLPGQLPPSYP